MRVAHVITGLGVGGAETMLSRLLGAIDPKQVESTVVALWSRGPMAERIEASGVPVEALAMARGIPSVSGFAGLRRALARFKPDLVQTWMYHADLLGGLAARSLDLPVVWSLRQSNLGRDANRIPTLLVMGTCARLSAVLPMKIVCGSDAARRAHEGIGYAPDKMILISNGFDTALFRPSPIIRSEVRRELSIGLEAPVIGLVARFDKQKDHLTFADAAGQILRQIPEVVFVLCGEGIDESNSALVEAIHRTGALRSFRLLGIRDDVQRLTTAFDIAVSSSIGEGLPNAIGEAMACCVPCVVTDVGDSSRLVGNTGLVVAPRDPAALANAVIALLAEGGEALRIRGEGARARIEQDFSLSAAAHAHVRLWREVAACVA